MNMTFSGTIWMLGRAIRSVLERWRNPWTGRLFAGFSYSEKKDAVYLPFCTGFDKFSVILIEKEKTDGACEAPQKK
ncbi:MAG: hypothetical protein ACI4DT_06265 [Chordicoccus sp.]